MGGNVPLRVPLRVFLAVTVWEVLLAFTSRGLWILRGLQCTELS